MKDENVPFIYYNLVDINNDGTQKLVMNTGTCNADTQYVFYTYKNNQVIELGSNTI